MKWDISFGLHVAVNHPWKSSSLNLLIQDATFYAAVLPTPPPPPTTASDREKNPVIISAVFCAQGPLLACIWIYKHSWVNKGIYACMLCTPPYVPSMQHTVKTVSPESSRSSLSWKKAVDRTKPCYDLLISCGPIYPFLMLMCDLFAWDKRSWKQGTSCSHQFTI